MPCERCQSEVCVCRVTAAAAGMSRFMRSLNEFGKAVQSLAKPIARVGKALQGVSWVIPSHSLAELTGTLPKSRYDWLSADYDLQTIADDWSRSEATGVDPDMTRFRQRVDDIQHRVEMLPSGNAMLRAVTTHRDPNLNDQTHCEMCCLPRRRHAHHKPPGNRPAFDPNNVSTEFKVWVAARNLMYLDALQQMDNEALLEMPLPVHRWRLRLISMELLERVDESEFTQRASHTRYAVLMMD